MRGMSVYAVGDESMPTTPGSGSPQMHSLHPPPGFGELDEPLEDEEPKRSAERTCQARTETFLARHG